MNDGVITVDDVPIERRIHGRHRANTTIRVHQGKLNKMCKVANLSANGCAVRTQDMSLKVGSQVDLVFAIDFGTLVKMHRRSATVAYVKNGLTGFRMEVYQAGNTP